MPTAYARRQVQLLANFGRSRSEVIERVGGDDGARLSATSDVTGRRTRVDDSASCVGNQPDARVIGRHRTTRNAPITHLLLTQLLTHQNASRCRVYSSRRPARLPDTESV